jgi:S1-C subfamily serine protease
MAVVPFRKEAGVARTRPMASLLLAAALAVAAPAAFATSTPDYARLLEDASSSVVGVQFEVRPRERPKGGEGPKVKRVLCGVFAGAPGQVMISGDWFPDLDDGPSAMVPVDFTLMMPGGVEVPAEAVGVDRELNLGFLQADPAALPGHRPVPFDGSIEATVGDVVVIIGVMPEEYGFAPVIHSARINGAIDRPRMMYSVDRVVQDLSIGGLVLLADGRPLGIVAEDLVPTGGEHGDRPPNVLSLIASANQGPRPGYPMVFPYPVFSRSLASPPRLQDESLENRGWLGITMQPLSRDLGDYWEISSPGGVIVVGVVENSPADRAGLRTGDVILGVNGRELPIRETTDLVLMQRRIRAAGAGRAVPLEVWRDGSLHPIEVRLVSSPFTITTAEEYDNEPFGIKVRALTYDYLQTANIDPETEGVLVIELERAGWGQISGLQRGDIILKVDGEPTPDLDAFRKSLESTERDRQGEVILFVMRGYKTQFFRVKTDWTAR